MGQLRKKIEHTMGAALGVRELVMGSFASFAESFATFAVQDFDLCRQQEKTKS